MAAVAEIAHRNQAKLAVDCTAATLVLTRPTALGADIVMHSASKYLNGHCDVLAGALICASPDSFWQRIPTWHRDPGAVLGPFEAWLLLRGMRTLFLRVERCSENALVLARHFAGHPSIAAVMYPGLPGDSGYALASHRGLSYMSFERDGDAGSAAALDEAIAEIAGGEGQRVTEMIGTVGSRRVCVMA